VRGTSQGAPDITRCVTTVVGRSPVKIVVTGGAGFIGANLCRLLAASGRDEVVALDDLSTGYRQNLAGVANVRLVEGSILESRTLIDVVRGAHSVVHLAARPSVPRSLTDPLASHEANATGTLRVLEAARQHDVGHVVVASSSSVYGANPVLPKHEGLVAQPRSPYAVSKLAAESYALAYAHSFGSSVLALRFFNVFGPLQAAGHAYAAVIPSFVSAALRGEALRVYGDGTQSRDFTFVGSVVGVLAEAAINQTSSETPVNLALGTRTSLLEVIEILGDILERTLAVEHVEPRAGDVAHSQADQTRFRALFPNAKAVSLVEGLAATVDWFRSCQSPSGSVRAGNP
jgi:UDP-glucose 4-epimerase